LGSGFRIREEKAADEKMSLCPLCRAEIPGNSTKCPFCGALFVEGSHPFILKGIECPNCGHRNYSYDYCSECRRAFTVVCPNCGDRVELSRDRCQSCGLKRDEFNVVRKLGPERFKRKKLMTFGLLALAVVLVVALIVAFFIPWGDSDEAEVALEEFANPRITDADADGIPEKIEHFDEQKRLVKVEEDVDADGNIDMIVWLDPQTEKPVRIERSVDMEGYKAIELYDKRGMLRTRLVVSEDETELVKVRECFSNSGVLLERWEDRNADGAFDLYQKFRPDGSVWVAAEDAGGEGFLSEWRFYNAQGTLIKKGSDKDGDGVFDELRVFNSSGRLIARHLDRDSDGFADEIVYYNNLGNVRWKEFDKDGDGLPEYFESYTQSGTFARRGYDINGDGKIDKWE